MYARPLIKTARQACRLWSMHAQMCAITQRMHFMKTFAPSTFVTNELWYCLRTWNMWRYFEHFQNLHINLILLFIDSLYVRCCFCLPFFHFDIDLFERWGGTVFDGAFPLLNVVAKKEVQFIFFTGIKWKFIWYWFLSFTIAHSCWLLWVYFIAWLSGGKGNTSEETFGKSFFNCNL